MTSDLEGFLVRHVAAGTVPGAVALRGGRDPEVVTVGVASITRGSDARGRDHADPVDDQADHVGRGSATGGGRPDRRIPQDLIEAGRLDGAGRLALLYATDEGLRFAGLAITFIPPLVLFLLLQRTFVQGLTAGTAR